MHRSAPALKNLMAAMLAVQAMGAAMAPSQRDIRIGGRMPGLNFTSTLGFGPAQLPRRHRSSNKFTPHQGARECERRRRQMKTGEFAPAVAALPLHGKSFSTRVFDDLALGVV